MKFPGIGEIDIENQDEDTLLEWYGSLDIWVWPRNMPCKPFMFYNLIDFHKPKDKLKNERVSKLIFIREIMNAISDILGYEKINKYKGSCKYEKFLKKKSVILQYKKNVLNASRFSLTKENT